MTKRTRTILFLICLLSFLLVAPSVLFYAKGYRVDFETKRVVQTGGLFLRIWPRNAEVYLNEKLKKKTDFFFNSVLIQNLLPKKYRIEVKKDGFHPWEKTLTIKGREVVTAKNIILFPKTPVFTILSENVEKFWFSPNQKKIILKEANEDSWSLKLYQLDKEIKSHLIDEGDIRFRFSEKQNGLGAKNVIIPSGAKVFPKKVDLLGLEFSENSKEIYLEVGLAEQIKYFILEIDEIPPTLTEKEAPQPPFKNIITYQKINNNIYSLDDSGHLFKDGDRLTGEAFPVKAETDYALKIFQDFVFLQEEKTLYQLNPDSKAFEKLFEKMSGLKVSPYPSEKLAYFSNHEIWILFLERAEERQRKAVPQLFLTRLSEKINDLFWMGSNYLIFNTDEKIKIIEIDVRDGINIVNLAEFKKAEIFWNKMEKRLYVLSENKLLYSSVLLP